MVNWRLWDARVVDVPMASNLACDMRSSLECLCFKSHTQALRFADHAGAYAPGIQYERPDHVREGKREVSWCASPL